MTRILIWGAGAIGGVAGAFLIRQGFDVTLVDNDPAHVAAIRAKGLAISGPNGEFTAHLPVVEPDRLRGTWSQIFLAVKSQHTEAACRQLLPYLAASGYVLSLQNGLCYETVAKLVGPPRTIAACVNYAGDMLGPGAIRFGARGALYLGEVDGTRTPRLAALGETLRRFEPETEVTDDIAACLWGKLCFTVLLIAQTIGQASIADCLARPELLPLWRRLVGEVIAIAAALGVTPRAFDGIAPAAFAPDRPESETADCIRALVEFNRRGAKSHSGYWRDVAVRRRRSEAEFHLRPVIDVGNRNGVECVALRRLLDMLLDVEEGRRPQADGNLLILLDAAR